MLKKITSFRLIVMCFSLVILLGTFLLMLPISSASGEWTSFIDSLFTSTSATCVTGLVVVDTGTYWSMFGQTVILLLIQIGGLGIITIFVYILSLLRDRLSIRYRTIMEDAISAPNIASIVPLTRFIFTVTFIIEFIGAVCLMPTFISDYGVGKGIWFSFFHSISAFCNAGFDLLGNFSSLTSYSSNIIINIVISLLIVIGGLSFLTWYDIKRNKLNFKFYSLQSKIIISVTIGLIILPAVYLFFFEFGDLPLRERLLSSMFQSITPRTAGFNTVDLGIISESGLFVIIMLMLIGAAPSSTGGGMKVTTVAVVFSTLMAVIFRNSDTQLFKKRIPNGVVMNALAIFFMYITISIISAMIISKIENLPILDCLFECCSAIATVGLTTGITTSLGYVSQVIIIFLMFFGRMGGLTIVFAAMYKRKKDYSSYPQESVVIG